MYFIYILLIFISIYEWNFKIYVSCNDIEFPIITVSTTSYAQSCYQGMTTNIYIIIFISIFYFIRDI